MLHPGLYEQVINNSLAKALSEIEDRRKEIAKIDKAEASTVLSQYVAEIIRKGLDYVQEESGNEEEKLEAQVQLVNSIISTVQKATHPEYFEGCNVDQSAQQLWALLSENDPRLHLGQAARNVLRPETSLAQSTLFTGGSVHEPQLMYELKKEIATADRVDMLVSFIKWSGLSCVMDELRAFTENGGRLRVITTSYMGATEVKAIEELRQLPNTQIKVSYDTKRTRLHAKTYIFHRDTGFSTAYVGSSNLSNVAISSGMEWNLKITNQDLPETIQKVDATFESYWNSAEFDLYTESQCERLKQALSQERNHSETSEQIYLLDVRPYPYQQEILDCLQTEREVHLKFRNLVIAATGTGKTILSALDYKRFREQQIREGKSHRLLFVAHREEILRQSRNAFRQVLKDPNFGDLYVGNERPASLDHLFISIQTFNSRDFTHNTQPTDYDFIIVDEFHHAAATSYQPLLTYYTPSILLGLTATPERMDGENVLQYFEYRIAAEIRLPEAINRKLLCPFHYFGVTDTVNLDSVIWRSGGYEKSALSKLYTTPGQVAENRADHIIRSLQKYVSDIQEVKGLGFCVTVEHAHYMAAYFNAHGIPSMALTGNSPDDERRNAKNNLVSGKIRFIFVVDIYNEGVDIPEVNTVLFLRPTESLTIFLQQLGRGLRLADNKDCLTVLDFIGLANQRYNFEEKFAALQSDSSKSVAFRIENGFTSIPRGCFFQLERQASEYVLRNIRAAFGQANSIVSRIRTFTDDTDKPCTLQNFLEYYHKGPASIYRFATFSRLCVKAGITPDFNEPLEDKIHAACTKFMMTDSRHWIQFLLHILPMLGKIELEVLTPNEKAMLFMFGITIWYTEFEKWTDSERIDHIHQLALCPRMIAELIDLLTYQFNRIDFIDRPIDLGFECPLELYNTYTREQLLTALGYPKPSTVQQGVIYLENKNLDVFLITTQKSNREYSPSTLYQDYAINEHLFHWQSQNTTSDTSPTGKRYIQHQKQGSKILLFVRETKKHSALTSATEAYTFLGTARYVKHTGSKPMSILWKLDYPIPAKFLKKANSLIAG